MVRVASTPIPVRFSPEILARLEDAARKMGLEDRTSVIKFCLATFLDYYERRGFGKLRPEWETILAELDGRTKEAKIAAEAKPKYGRRQNGNRVK